MDSSQLHATEWPGNEVKSDHQAEHDTESEAFLSRTWRQAREDEMLVLSGTGTDPMHQRRFNGARTNGSGGVANAAFLASDHIRQALLRPKTS